ncbi:hypothetical protein L596_018553 [Steinernema carpocapsae]|uniref:Uncharacterized protein n=1 Tax=Steinernema carpocapsae TaxID=34508 RepID=A0A4U5N508_STECR|nr:hypothetical protein L596_018553 [Steinernema carpocapsae]
MNQKRKNKTPSKSFLTFKAIYEIKIQESTFEQPDKQKLLSLDTTHREISGSSFNTFLNRQDLVGQIRPAVRNLAFFVVHVFYHS